MTVRLAEMDADERGSSPMGVRLGVKPPHRTVVAFRRPRTLIKRGYTRVLSWYDAHAFL